MVRRLVRDACATRDFAHAEMREPFFFDELDARAEDARAKFAAFARSRGRVRTRMSGWHGKNDAPRT
jgi:hypothetical protein